MQETGQARDSQRLEKLLGKMSRQNAIRLNVYLSRFDFETRFGYAKKQQTFDYCSRKFELSKLGTAV